MQYNIKPRSTATICFACQFTTYSETPCFKHGFLSYLVVSICQQQSWIKAKAFKCV